MKKLFFLFLFFFFLTTHAFAMCLAWGIYAWPKTPTVSLNSIFIVEGYGASQTIIHNLDKKHLVYLKSTTSKVPLEVVRVLEGEVFLTQAILKPKYVLTPNTVYTLEIDSLNMDEGEKMYAAFDNCSWTTTNSIDNTIPNWTKDPEYLSKRKVNLGCGPERLVNFSACINDVSPVVVFTKLKETRTGKVHEYYVAPDSLLLRVGRSMCSGEFDYIDGEHYEVTFSLMDASGNINSTLTDPISFVSPTDNETGKNKKNKKPCNCTVPIDNSGTIYFVVSITAILILGRIIFRNKSL